MSFFTIIFSSSNFVILITLSFLCFSPVFAASTDTLTSSQSLTINQTLISAGAKFQLGFFTKGNPKRYYAGIWYKDIPSDDTKVWVANRDSPSLNDSCTLKLDDQSNLVILDDGSNLKWNSSSNKSTAKNPVLQLLDSGNLVIRESGDNNPDHYIWQSFDHPTDTLIPGQKLGWNLKTGLNRFLTSWQGPDNPSSGKFTFKMDYHGDPEIYMRDRAQIIYRSGPWVGQRFSGVPEMATSNNGINFIFHRGKNEVYYTFKLPPIGKIKSRLIITYMGKLERWTWVPNTSQWTRYWAAPDGTCDYYKACGPYTVCNTSLMFNCECPQGFEPKEPQDWALRDGSSGCVRKTELNCKSDGFVKMVNMKLPESLTTFVNEGLDLDECRERCKQNCSCTAFANLNVVQGSGNGCVFWTGSLIDMRDYVQGGQDLYLRLAASDLGSLASGDSSDDSARKFGMGIGIAIASAIIVAGLITLMILKRKKAENIIRRTPDTRASRTGATERSQEVLLSAQIISSKRDYSGETKNLDDVELPIFDIYTMAAATNNFDDANKLGQGGFGRVYKGVMLDGQEVAVKRLSKESGQGAEEFKNEVRLIAKLQHRNLVRLLGCCVEMDEKMLIYEYLKNRSLDAFLFHKERSAWLNWQTRFNIICGIARGLLYLHQDSRYRIIHRDLKASNVLLDGDMNPKISDFGMARIFGGDQTEGNTRRVVGTYGYMAPEYAMDGLFSTKSDVFSFGVLVLEIVSGTKNRGFYNSDQELNLLGYSWKVWREGKGTELVDKVVGDVYSIHEVLRCLQVGLLCVQERAEDRPAMGSVVLMLSSESASLPQPKLPGFCMGWNPNETDSSSSKQEDESFTVNQVTVTMLNAR